MTASKEVLASQIQLVTAALESNAHPLLQGYLEYLTSLQTVLDAQNIGAGVGLYQQKSGRNLALKTLYVTGNGSVVDHGDSIELALPGAFSDEFDIPFTDHIPGGNFQFKTPRGSVAKFSTGEDIARVSILTPWPADGSEVKAAIHLNLAGRLAVATTPADAQLISMDGTLHLQREGSNWISGTPSFDGNAASGMQIMVGSRGGFIAIEITFRSGALAREVYCVASGFGYASSTTDKTLTVSVNGTTITGPTDVFGCSGIRAFSAFSTTAILVPTKFESRGRFLEVVGQIQNTAGWPNGTVIAYIPPPFQPRINTYKSTALIAGGFSYGNLLLDTTGNVTLLSSANATLVQFSPASPFDLRGF